MKYLKPTCDRVLIRREEAKEESKGGIILPAMAQEKPQRGEVIRLGPDSVGLQLGDKVIFTKYSGSEVQVEDEVLIVMKSEDVLLIVE